MPAPEEKKKELKVMIRAVELVEAGVEPSEATDDDPGVKTRMETYIKESRLLTPALFMP